MGLKEKYTLTKDRLRALFSLSSFSSAEKSLCPSDGELAAFMDGGLAPEEREVILVHLESCPTCYNEWLAASSILSDERKQRHEETEISDSAFKKTLKKSGRNRSYMAFGIALAASLILFILFPVYHHPEISSLIEKQYKTAQTYSISSSEIDFLKDREGNIVRGYGFIDANRKPGPAAESFMSGMQSGWNLLKNDPKSKPEKISPERISNDRKDYYWAGRWYALVTALCQSDQLLSEKFLEDQKKVIETLQSTFSPRVAKENEAMVVTRSLERMMSMVSKDKIDLGRTCRSLQLELEIVVKGLVPYEK